jgi:hypothetical protein
LKVIVYRTHPRLLLLKGVEGNLEASMPIGFFTSRQYLFPSISPRKRGKQKG